MAPTLPSELGEVTTPDSPAWWLRRLEANLDDRLPQLSRNERYYRGEHELAFAMERFRIAFGKTFRTFANNWMPMVVDACAERLQVQGFRIPTAEETAPRSGDTESWDMWQANNLDGYSAALFTDTLAHGLGYMIVGPGGEYPEITIESGFEVICESAPGYRLRRLAALKRWRDPDGFLNATLYLPEAIWKLRSSKPVDAKGRHMGAIAWVARPGEDFPMRNPIGEVPVVPFYNRPRLAVPYEGEFQQLIPMQNACNKLFMDMLVASEYGAFRQRWMTGIEVPRDPETKEVLTSFKKQVLEHVMVSENQETAFGNFEATDLGNYVAAIETIVQNIATQSKTPPHYFFLKGELPSGETLKSAETPLVTKVRGKQVVFGESLEEVVRLAFLMRGNEDKAEAARRAETIWADPETRSESEHIDALTKQLALGIPPEILWEKAGYSPEEIVRIKEIKAAEPSPAEPAGGAPGAAEMAGQMQIAAGVSPSTT